MRVGVVVQEVHPGKEAVVRALISNSVGYGTSVIAEYRAIAAALEWCSANKELRVVIYTDSQLCERQLSGQYRVVSPALKVEWGNVKRLAAGLESADIRWHRRSEGLGPIADALAKGGKSAARVVDVLINKETPHVE
jgi:ribonuclease HI